MCCYHHSQVYDYSLNQTHSLCAPACKVQAWVRCICISPCGRGAWREMVPLKSAAEEEPVEGAGGSPAGG